MSELNTAFEGGGGGGTNYSNCLEMDYLLVCHLQEMNSLRFSIKTSSHPLQGNKGHLLNE